MIEVLVTILIMAVGLLGLAGMQSLGLRASANNYLSGQAQGLTQELIDRIQSNIRAGAAGEYAGNSPFNSAQDCLAATCTPEQMAEFELAQWWDRVSMMLPQAEATIGFSVANQEYGIAITWDAEKAGDDYSAPACDADTSNPNCLFTAVRPRVYEEVLP